MKVEIESQSEVEKKVHVELSKEEMEAERQKSLRELQKTAQVKGFRVGKVPFSVLEKWYGDRITYELTDRVVQERLALVVWENQFIPMLQPALTAMSYNKGEAMSFDLRIDIKPTLEINEAHYKGLTLTAPKHTVSEEEINAALEHVCESQSELEPTEPGQAFDKGWVGIIEFNGTINGVPFEGGSAYNYVVELGRGQLLPPFEAAMEGLKKDEEKTFSLTFPPEYHREDLRNKSAEFVVKILDIKKKKLPAIDDEFAKDLGHDSLAALRDKIAEDIVLQKEHAHRLKLYEQIVDHLITTVSCPVPRALVEKEKGMSGRSEEEATKRLQADFILEVIAMLEGCKIESQDVEARLQEISMVNRTPVAQVLDYYQKNNLLPYLQFQVLAKKALDAVVGYAEIKVTE